MVIGYAASIFLAPTPIININDDLNRIKPPEKQVKVILLYDDNCSVCEQSHSFLGILQRSGIEVYLAKVPLSDKEGKKIILDFNISQLPTLLVVKSTVAPEMKVKMLGAENSLQETLEAIGTEKYDYYIVEEGNFDGVAHTTTLLSGMTFSYCEDPKNIAVDLFEDPYSPNTIKFKTTTWDVREMFDKNVNFQYGFMPTVTDKYPPIIQEKAQYLAEAMLCSIQAGKFNEFERAFYTKYCDKNGNNRLDAGEMEQCTTGGAALPLEESEVNKVAQDANIPVDLINVCRKELVGIFLESSKNKANMFLVTTTPTAVVQCKYKTHPKYLKDVICFVKPELEACKQSATGTNPKNSPDTNTGK